MRGDTLQLGSISKSFLVVRWVGGNGNTLNCAKKAGFFFLLLLV